MTNDDRIYEVKALRLRTGSRVTLKNCKRALEETNWDRDYALPRALRIQGEELLRDADSWNEILHLDIGN